LNNLEYREKVNKIRDRIRQSLMLMESLHNDKGILLGHSEIIIEAVKEWKELGCEYFKIGTEKQFDNYFEKPKPGDVVFLNEEPTSESPRKP
jgi:hypothetical protein